MSKTEIDKNANAYPMPVTIVGAMVDGKPNFLAVAWIARVNYNPPMVAIALGKAHHTNKGIHANKAFSVNIPGCNLIVETDYVGMVSGKKKDKSRIFDVFFGKMPSAPMVRECPLCMECRLVQAVDLPTNTLFIGEIVAAYAEDDVLVDGKPHVAKLDPFTLTMPDNVYRKVGEHAGRAWGSGKKIQKG